jgi:hypothetical protein
LRQVFYLTFPKPYQLQKITFLFCLLFFSAVAFAQVPKADTTAKSKPDTVKLGIYVTSIHDIDFRQKEYNINFWIWLKYKNRAFDFARNLEIPNAKTFTTAYTTIDSSGDQVYLQMKMQCTMKDSWKIDNFPFDRQTLRLSFENSQFDSTKLVFAADTIGANYDKRIDNTGKVNNNRVMNGWLIDSFEMTSRGRLYKTAFGDESMNANPQVTYSALRIKISISREASGLFWKMFLGMYIAFLIAFVCFFIHSDGMDSRFGLSVGSIFAVIGNKYIIDSSLPESTSFTLVDTLHGLTLTAIFVVISATAYSLKLVKQQKMAKAQKFDRVMAVVLFLIYITMNIWFIYQASNSAA